MRPTTQKKMQTKPFTYTTATLMTKIKNIMSSQKPFIFFGGREASEKDLAAFMYKVNFLSERSPLSLRVL